MLARIERLAPLDRQRAQVERNHDQQRRDEKHGVVDPAVDLRDEARDRAPHIATVARLERSREVPQRERHEHRGLQLEVLEMIEAEGHERERDAGNHAGGGAAGQAAARTTTSPRPITPSRRGSAGCRRRSARRPPRSPARRRTLARGPSRCRRASAFRDGRCCRSAGRRGCAGSACAIQEIRQMLSSGSSASGTCVDR